MDRTYFYHASAHWALHEHGLVKAGEEIPQSFNFSSPPEFGGETGLWTPEHMLLGAVAACFVATFRGVARASKLEFQGIDVSVEGIIEKQEGGLRFTKVHVRPDVTIFQDADRERATLVLEKTERLCLIARSLSASILLHPRVETEAPVAV